MKSQPSDTSLQSAVKTWEAMQKAGETFKPPRAVLSVPKEAATGSDGIPQKVAPQKIPVDVRFEPKFSHYRDQGVRPVMDQARPPRRTNADVTLDELIDIEHQQHHRVFFVVCGYHLQTHVKEDVSQIHLTLRNPKGRTWPEQILYFHWMTS